MKKAVFIAAIILISGIAFGQNLKKGNLIGVHTMTINLKPGVTMEQFIQFYSNKVIPEMNKLDPEWQVYLVKSIRGNINENSIGMIHLLKSDNVRSKYYKADGTQTELGISANAKIKPVMDELEKLGTVERTWTDWIVQ
jgi:hypothetical protein